MAITRRTFCTQAVPLLLAPRLLLSQSKATARPGVAAIDHDRILRAATPLLTQAPTPLTALPCPRSPGSPHDFYSEPDDYWPDPANPNASFIQRVGQPNPAAFTAHRVALLNLCIAVPTLTAAYLITHDLHYAQQSVAHLRAWFVVPTTAMTPNLAFAQTIPPNKAGRFEGVIEAVHLAELVQSVSFLATTEALSDPDRLALEKWFADYFDWLNTSRLAGLARDNKSHHGTSWLLQAAAIAHLTQEKDDSPLTTLRHQYRGTTLRSQITGDGTFPHELTTSNPYRNSLFNLDMLAAICLLLTTRFDNAWDYELQDGPGMRNAIARHFPYIANRGAWPYRADDTFFAALPIRPPSLLFAARAYDRPEYASLWTTLTPDPPVPELQHTFPIRQPLLWVTRPKP